MRHLTWQVAHVEGRDTINAPFQQWPSTRELDQDELYTIPGQSIPSEGEGAVARPAQVFSSRNPKTVRRHFRWMREHHIAGVFLQRFLSGMLSASITLRKLLTSTFWAEVKNGDDDLRRLRDEVLQLVRASAEAEGRVVSILRYPDAKLSADSECIC